MNENPATALKTLVRAFIEMAEREFPLELAAVPIIAADPRGDDPLHLQILFTIDGERLGKTAEELAEQADYDQRFDALTNSLGEQLLREKLAETSEEVKEKIKKFLDG